MYDDCDGCVREEYCIWCQDTNVCQNTTAACANPTGLACPQKKKFDGWSFFGGLVLGAAVLGIIIGLIFLFSWQKTRKYQPV
jgi:hypothetical protein